MSKHVLVTGASGFVGKHLIRLLLDGDYVVHAAVFGGALDITHDRLFPVSLDLTSKDSIDEVVRTTQPDWVFHLAALSSPAASFSDGNKTVVNNIVAQANVLSAVMNFAPHARILVIGSAEEYGHVDANQLPINESCPLRPMSPYAVSKLTQDFMGLQHYLSYRTDIVRVRPFNHVGEWQVEQFVLPAFAKQVALIEAGKQEPVIHVGNLSATRDFTDVKDMVRAYEKALQFGVSGEVYNLGSGREVAIQQLLDLLLSHATLPITVVQDPNRMQPSDVPRLCCDSQKFEQLTGWKAEIPLEDTIVRVLDYWRTVAHSV
jgi:GDP-4-dehydro-6-deoxy-D-mannose reductase